MADTDSPRTCARSQTHSSCSPSARRTWIRVGCASGLEQLSHVLRLFGGEEQLACVVDTLLVEDEDLAGAIEVLIVDGRRIPHVRKNIETN